MGRKGRLARGFMLVEMLISVAIMTMISSVVLSANSQMSARIQTDNMAHQIALKVREAQIRALSSKVSAGSTATAPGYGVYFNGLASDVVPFLDMSGGSGYTMYPNEGLTTMDLNQGYSISSMNVSGVTTPTGQKIQQVSILFRRPSSDPVVQYSLSSTGPTLTTALNAQADIVIRSPKGFTKTVTVTPTGQIYVH